MKASRCWIRRLHLWPQDDQRRSGCTTCDMQAFSSWHLPGVLSVYHNATSKLNLRLLALKEYKIDAVEKLKA